MSLPSFQMSFFFNELLFSEELEAEVNKKGFMVICNQKEISKAGGTCKL